MYYDFERQRFKLTSAEKLYILDNLPLHIRSFQIKNCVQSVQPLTLNSEGKPSVVKTTFSFISANIKPSKCIELTASFVFEFSGDFPKEQQ